MKLFLPEQWRIYAYIHALVSNRADCEELLQDVAVVLWSKFDEFVPGTRFDRWAYSVAHHKIANFNALKHRKTVLFDGHLFELLSEHAARQAEQVSEQRDALDVCMQQLSAQNRRLLHQRFQHNATNRSVAKEAGQSESNMSRRLNGLYMVLLECIQSRLKAAEAEEAP